MKIIILVSILVLLILLIKNKFKPSVLFGSLACFYFLFDFISFDNFIISYTNTSLIVLILLIFISLVLEKTLLMDLLSNLIIDKSYNKTLVKLGIFTALSSAFLNNTAVVASMMGVIKNNKYHLPSKLLIPLSYSAIFGGTLTLIGTSTNLLINSFLIDNNVDSLFMFDFFYVGIFVVIFGLLALFIFKGLLPEYQNDNKEIQEHLIEVKVLKDSTIIGKSIKANGLRNLGFLYLIEIQRDNKIISPVLPYEIIQEDDKLLFSGDIKHIEVLNRFNNLSIENEKDIKNLNLLDVIITPESTLINKKVKESNFRAKFNAAIISLKRGSKSISKIGEESLQSGDRLILSIGKDFETRDNIAKNFYILSTIKKSEKLSKLQSIFVISGFISAIFISVFSILPFIKSLLIYLLFLLTFKCIKVDDFKRRFPFDLFVIIGSSLVISKVIISSGLANDLAQIIINTFGHYGIYGSFIGIFIFTLVLTEIITNNAAAALSFPIAYATAISLDVSIYPFIFAVAFGASASFIFPYGYQTNLMVYSLGNYTNKDFIRIGMLISLVYCVVCIVTIPIFYPF